MLIEISQPKNLNFIECHLNVEMYYIYSVDCKNPPDWDKLAVKAVRWLSET